MMLIFGAVMTLLVALMPNILWLLGSLVSLLAGKHLRYAPFGYASLALTVSGHTHAAQLSLFGWNPSSWMFKRSYGRYDVGGQTIYVNPGLGCTLPFRIGARPEVTVITLK